MAEYSRVSAARGDAAAAKLFWDLARPSPSFRCLEERSSRCCVARAMSMSMFSLTCLQSTGCRNMMGALLRIWYSGVVQLCFLIVNSPPLAFISDPPAVNT